MAGIMEEKELESKRDKRRAPKPPPKPKRGNRKYSRDSSLTVRSLNVFGDKNVVENEYTPNLIDIVFVIQTSDMFEKRTQLG